MMLDAVGLDHIEHTHRHTNIYNTHNVTVSTSDRSAIRFVHFFGEMDKFLSVFSPMSYRKIQTDRRIDIINLYRYGTEHNYYLAMSMPVTRQTGSQTDRTRALILWILTSKTRWVTWLFMVSRSVQPNAM